MKKEKKAEVEKPLPEALPEEKEHVFLYPDIEKDTEKNFEDELNFNGVKIKRVCKNGIIRTRNKLLIDFMLQKKYELLEVIK